MKTKNLQKGTYTIFWVISLPLVLAFGAFAIDMNNLHLAQTELQAAADAGALRGARILYKKDGKLNSASIIETEVKNAVMSSNQKINHSINPNTEITIDLGHWKFKPSGISIDSAGIERGGDFSAWNRDASSLAPLVNPVSNSFYTFLELNELDGSGTKKIDVNSVRVFISRKQNKVATFFHGFLGKDSGFEANATAVAYIGLSGTTTPNGPFAICLSSILKGLNPDGSRRFSCNDGFKFGNGNNMSGDIVWTDQKSPCVSGGASVTTIRDNVLTKMPQCNAGTSIGAEHNYGTGINLMLNAVANTNFDAVYNCWWNDPKAYSGISGRSTSNGPDTFWPLTIPVIDCNAATTGCGIVLGTVSVNVIWIVTNDQGDNKMDQVGNVPMYMDDWDGSGITGTNAQDAAMNRWESFAAHFKIRESSGAIAGCGVRGSSGNNCDGYEQKSIYLAPNCSEATSGNTGGSQNIGVRAVEPVLVY
jgi:hypothetical protein